LFSFIFLLLIKTDEFAIIDKKGYIVTYYKLKGGYERFKEIEKEKLTDKVKEGKKKK